MRNSSCRRFGAPMGFNHGRLPGGVILQVVANALDPVVATGNCVGSGSVGDYVRGAVRLVIGYSRRREMFDRDGEVVRCRRGSS